MHGSCMATKTISLELDAYDKLRDAKRPGESFSAVVRRMQVATPAPSGGDLLKRFETGGSGVEETYLDAVEAATAQDQAPDNPWN